MADGLSANSRFLGCRPGAYVLGLVACPGSLPPLDLAPGHRGAPLDAGSVEAIQMQSPGSQEEGLHRLWCALARGGGPGSVRKYRCDPVWLIEPGVFNLLSLFSRYAASGGCVLCLPSDPLSERPPSCLPDARHCCHPCANYHCKHRISPCPPGCRPTASCDTHHPRGPAHAARRQGERPWRSRSA